MSTNLSQATIGVCTPWVTSAEILTCCTQAPPGTDLTAQALIASNILFHLSGRRFTGVCEQTVRPQCTADTPCAPYEPWSQQTWDRRHGTPRPAFPCSCDRVCKVPLAGYPVRRVIEVRIDGAVVPPGTYRVDEYRWLVRTNDECWPACQIMHLPSTQPGTWSVTYEHGTEPPPEAVQAASRLACELYRACNPGECALPPQTTRAVRQGIAYDVQNYVGFFGRGRTGLMEVDAFLAVWRDQHTPAVWSPDLPAMPWRANTPPQP